MLSEEVKFHLTDSTTVFREVLLSTPKIGPKEIVAKFIEKLVECGKEFDLEEVTKQHVKELQKNRAEAEELVAGILGMR